MRVNRLNEMESYVFAQGSASLEDLSRQFDISLNTARRDVNELLKRGTIQKVYGGVPAGRLATQRQSTLLRSLQPARSPMGRLSSWTMGQLLAPLCRFWQRKADL